MCEQYVEGIEHPNQSWWQDNATVHLTTAQQDFIADRFEDVPLADLNRNKLFRYVERATEVNHSRRTAYELANRALLGVTSPSRNPEDWGPKQREYDQLTGRPKKVGEFVSWFSFEAHQAYLARDEQEKGMTDEQKAKISNRLVDVSLEFGGTRQFTDFEATHNLERMARSLPERILEARRDAWLDLYGHKWYEQVTDQRIGYKDHAPISYTLQLMNPLDQNAGWERIDEDQGKKFDIEKAAARLGEHPVASSEMPAETGLFDTDYLLLRRQKPLADVYVPGESDIVIFDQTIALVVLPMFEESLRKSILASCAEEVLAVLASVDKERKVNLKNTPAAKLIGGMFEAALISPSGETTEVLPISRHIIQGIGNKFGALRKQAA